MSRRRGARPPSAQAATSTVAPPPARRKVRGDALLRELGPGQTPALLRELQLLTRGGELNADALRKLKQINHLLRLLAPAVEGILARHEAPRIVDAGAGNAWLGLLLYEALLGPVGRGALVAIERRDDLVERVKTRAAALAMERVEVVLASVRDLTPAVTEVSGGPGVDGVGGVDDGALALHAAPAVGRLGAVHAVLALHACDTATDEAIILGLRHRAELIAVVPCCQAEAGALLEGRALEGPLAPLWRHGLHRREFCAHLTNVVRALVLEAHGYRVRVTELVGWEHSLKNELIIAERHQRGNRHALGQLHQLLARLPPLPLWLLAEAGLPAAATHEPGS